MIPLLIDDLYPSMPWDELDTVVFDVGNVLVSFEPQRMLDDLIEDRSLHPVLMERVFRSPYWNMQDRGILDREEAIRVMTGRYRELAAPIRTLMENWDLLKRDIPEGVEALRECKAHGKRILILSNYADYAFRFVQEHFDFFRLADGFVVSSRLGLCKPDASIYRYAAETYGLDPKRTLFIDDTPLNVEAALVQGWQGFCLNRPGKLRAFLRPAGTEDATEEGRQ